MVMLGEFIAVGTQLKVEKPGKGCVAAPVDSIEGPFVKLNDGRALRINDPKALARELKDKVAKIIAVGRHTGHLRRLQEVQHAHAALKLRGGVLGGPAGRRGLRQPPSHGAHLHGGAGALEEYKVPMHPRYTYEYLTCCWRGAGGASGSRIAAGKVEPVRMRSPLRLARPEIAKMVGQGIALLWRGSASPTWRRRRHK